MTSNTDIVRAFGRAWASKDPEVVMAFFADDAVYGASVGPEPGTTCRGRQEIRHGITAHRLFGAGFDGPLRLKAVERPFMACVWEQVGTEHERRAWIASMMQDRPDPQAYLANAITPGLY